MLLDYDLPWCHILKFCFRDLHSFASLSVFVLLIKVDDRQTLLYN